MAGHLNVPMTVAALHDLGVSYVVGPRQHFDRLPRDALISGSSRARLILSCFRRDASVMARLRILLASDPTCGIACNRISDHSVVERVAQLVERRTFCLAEIRPIAQASVANLHYTLGQIHPADEQARAATCGTPLKAAVTSETSARKLLATRSGAPSSEKAATCQRCAQGIRFKF